MLFTNRPNSIDQNLHVSINSKNVAYEDKLKFLGNILDKTLSFENHINLIISKISKTIGIFYKLRNCSPKTALISLYYNLIYPYLMYGNLIWGNAYKDQFSRILLLQKKGSTYNFFCR